MRHYVGIEEIAVATVDTPVTTWMFITNEDKKPIFWELDVALADLPYVFLALESQYSPWPVSEDRRILSEMCSKGVIDIWQSRKGNCGGRLSHLYLYHKLSASKDLRRLLDVRASGRDGIMRLLDAVQSGLHGEVIDTCSRRGLRKVLRAADASLLATWGEEKFSDNLTPIETSLSRWKSLGTTGWLTRLLSSRALSKPEAESLKRPEAAQRNDPGVK